MLAQRTSTPYYATTTINVGREARPNRYHRRGSPTVVMFMHQLNLPPVKIITVVKQSMDFP